MWDMDKPLLASTNALYIMFIVTVSGSYIVSLPELLFSDATGRRSTEYSPLIR